MVVEVPEKFPFSVDTWTPCSIRKKYHFLTHAHKDHTAGIGVYGSYPIYCTSITKQLLLQRYPRLDESMFVELAVGESVLIDEIDGPFTVTAFDANHCPGAVMLLFEGYFGNVLHTGDCRLSTDCLANLPHKFTGKSNKASRDGLDYLYLDCTFGRESFKMPSRNAAIEQVLSCIWKHPSTCTVYLACDILGQEEILMEISRTFGSKIYVDRTILVEYHAVISFMAPHMLTEDPSCRFHVCEGFPRLYERAKAKFVEAKRNLQADPLFVRPSAQWYTCEERLEGLGSELMPLEVFRRRRTQVAPKEAERDQFGVWHVCYSMHSSQDELEAALELLCPKEVISTTANCRATELQYVRHRICNAGSYFDPDPGWQFKISMRSLFQACSTTRISQGSVIKASMVHVAQKTSSPREREKQSMNLCVALEGQHNQTQPQFTSPTKPIPLFGRARHGLPPSPPMSFSDDEEDACRPSECRVSSCYIADPEPPSPLPLSKNMEDIVPYGKSQSQFTNFTGTKDPHFEGRSSPPSRLNNEEEGKLLSVKRALDMEVDFRLRAPLGRGEPCTETRSSPSPIKDGEIWNNEQSCITEKNCWSFDSRNSRTLHESVRKMYRSLHVPIPQPLPSLMDLANLNKRPKLRAPQN